MHLHEQGVFDWDDFRDHLVAEVAAHGTDSGDRYYERWLASLNRVVLERGLFTDEEIAKRAGVLAQQDDHSHNDHE